MPNEEQIFPTKSGNFVDERHIYEGVQGPGIIGMKYRVVGTDMEILYTHQGPEARSLPNGWSLYASEDIGQPSGWVQNSKDCPRAADIKKVLDGDSVWYPDTGLEVI